MLARLALVTSFLAAASAQGPAPGLRLYQPIGAEPTRLVDTLGNIVHTWPGGGGLTSHVLPDGSLLRGVQTGAIQVAGATGRLQRLGLDGTLLWDYAIGGPQRFAHHDIEPMPNGNVLVIVWDAQVVADAIAQGRDPALVSGTDWLPDSIVEVRPTGPTTGDIVWEWHVTDHLVQDFDPALPNYGDPAAHRELVDLNYPPVLVADGDWNHFNGIDYDPIHDHIVISARSQNELWVIDHSTTTAEAAGHSGGNRGRGGDLLYRWGNPAAYRAGTAVDQQLFGQHDPRFVPPGSPGAGNVTLFNNQHTATQSAVFELVLPRDAAGDFVFDPLVGRYGPAGPAWLYIAPGFLSNFVSSAERLPNGNTLVCSGLQNELFEVTAAGAVVWSHVDPNSTLIFQGHYVDRSLWVDGATLSAAAGGTLGFDHLAGGAHAGQFHLLLGSVSGTAPGTPLPGGLTLPLQADFLTSAMAGQFNSGPFLQTFGTLDVLGAATSSIVAAPGQIPAALAGVQLDFATVLFDAGLLATKVSNVATVVIAP